MDKQNLKNIALMFYLYMVKEGLTIKEADDIKFEVHYLINKCKKGLDDIPLPNYLSQDATESESFSVERKQCKQQKSPANTRKIAIASLIISGIALLLRIIHLIIL